MATADENIRARGRAATLVEATVCKILQNTCRWLRAPNWLVQGNARGRGGVKNAKDEDILRRWRPIKKLYAHMWLDQPPLGHRPRSLQNATRGLRPPNLCVQGDAPAQGDVKNTKDEAVPSRWLQPTKILAHVIVLIDEQPRLIEASA